MKLESYLIELKDKYSSLSGLKKVGIGILIGIVTLAIGIFIYISQMTPKNPDTKILDQHKKQVDKTLKNLDKEKEVIEEKIKENNKEIKF